MDLGPSWSESIDRIVREAARENRSPRSRVRDVAAWIVHDPGRAHGIEALAARAAMSARSLERWFARELGTSPARFVHAARLALARRLLEETSLSVKSVALRCGYGNPERMRRAFQRSLGASPRRYSAAFCARVAPNA